MGPISDFRKNFTTKLGLVVINTVLVQTCHGRTALYRTEHKKQMIFLKKKNSMIHNHRVNYPHPLSSIRDLHVSANRSAARSNHDPWHRQSAGLRRWIASHQAHKYAIATVSSNRDVADPPLPSIKADPIPEKVKIKNHTQPPPSESPES